MSRMETEAGAVRIVPMTLSHLDGVCRIENDCFAHPWSSQSIAKHIASPQTCYFAALEGDEVVGYGGMMVVLDEGHITNIAVHPACRRRHIGQALLEELIRHAKTNGFAFLTLEVRASNDPAKGLYRKLGFGEAGRRPKYYGDEDALLMTLFL